MRRRLLDLTQQELADQVGCARVTLRRIEAGALKPSRELAKAFLDRFGIPPEEQEGWIRSISPSRTVIRSLHDESCAEVFTRQEYFSAF